MAGKLCGAAAATDQMARPKIAKAFCEGRSAEIAGTLKANNPYSATYYPLEKAAWDDGWDASAAADPKGCCAE